MKYNSPNVSTVLEAVNKILLLLIALLSAVGSGYAQNPSLKVFEDWNDTAGTQNMFQKNVVRPELGTTNVYVAGATLNAAGNYDLLVTKYNTSGTVLWTQQYNGNGNGDDYALDLQLDNSGNVYVTGTTYESATDSLNAITIMYDASGNLQWLSTYNGNGSGNDVGAALYVDNSTGEVFVAGSEWEGSSTLYDFLVLKYDNSGNQQWAANFDNTNLNDGAMRVTVNPGTGNVEAGGATQTTSTNRKYLVLEVDNSSGSYLNHYTSSSNTFGIDNLTDLKVDASGNVYVTGAVLNTTTGFDIRTIKLDTALNVVWSSTYAGSLDDMGNALIVDANNNVIVTGYSNTATQGKNFVTIKYNSAGTQQWASTFNGSANANDSATAIAVHDTNKIYVTGYSYNGSSKDYYTIRYDAAGNEIWGIGFNSINNGDDRAFEIVNDTTGQIYVTGQTKVNDSTYVYNTVKYVEKSTMLPDDTISFTSSSFVFTENRGQLMGTDTSIHPEVKFYTMRSSPNVFFMDTAVAYVFTRIDTASTNMDTLMRVDMKFVNSNSGQRIRPLDERSEYSNFFLSHIPEGRCNVQNYNQLVSFNVWNNVDVVYGSNLRGLKHYFVCKPGGGGNPATQIDLLYEGADSVALGASGELIIYTPLGTIVQPKAAAWQLDANGNYSSLGWQPNYIILGTNEVGFTAFGSYNAAFPIIIAADWGPPTTQSCVTGLPWSTFMGGTSLTDQFNDMVVNSAGEAVVCGHTMSTVFPIATLGIYTYSGGQDAQIINFHPGGAPNWGTYFGGNVTPTGAIGANESATSIDVNYNTSDLVFVGVTNSGSDLPLVAWGNYNQTANGGTSSCSGGNCNDQFVARLSANGQVLLYSSYYGGVGDDKAYSVAVSSASVNDEQICMVGAGGSGFPQVNSSWSTVGSTIVKWNPNGNRIWSAMSLGNVNCIIYGNDYDAFGNVILVGATGTSSFVTTTGVQQTTYGGGSYDAFVTKINTNNTIDWSTFLGGSGTDIAWDVVVTPLGSAPEYFVTGSTTSGSGGAFPTTPGAYQSAFGGGIIWGDAFVSQLNGTTGTLQYSTYHGGSNNEIGRKIILDQDRNVFITGDAFTGGLPLIQLFNAYNDGSFNGGGTDNFIVCYYRDASNNYWPVWSTYFGGNGTDHSYAIGYDTNEGVYIAGYAHAPLSYELCQGTTTSFGPRYWDGTLGTMQAFIALFDVQALNEVGITEQNNQQDITIFPNPSNGQFSLVCNFTSKETIAIEVVDVAGQLLFVDQYQTSPNVYHTLDLSNLANGLYFIRVKHDDDETIKKVIIRK